MVEHDDLLQYLLRLHDTLRRRGAPALAEKVRLASYFATGSTSEYYAEAQRALKGIVAEQERILCDQELGELSTWLNEIDAAFKRIGGA